MPVLDWAEAEATLVALARLERQLEDIEAYETEEIARVHSEAERRRSIPAGQREALRAALEQFTHMELTAGRNLNSVQVPRSLRLSMGRVGYRPVHAVEIRSEPAASRALSATPWGRRFLRVSRAINREALRAFLMKGARGGHRGRWRRLQQAGVRLARRDYWFCEVPSNTLGHWG